MLVFFEIGSSVLLLLSMILPHQNFAMLGWFAAGMLVLWAAIFARFRTRKLLSSSLLFYFCLLLSFHARAATEAGPLIWWYGMILWAQWGALLWFSMRSDRSVAALFVCITLISPLFMPVLNVRSESFIGVAFWILAVAHAALILKESQLKSHPFVWMWLAVSLLPIPFALYYWRAVQFLWIQVAVLVLYAIAAGMPRDQLKRAMLSGYIFLGFWIVVFAIWRDAYTIPWFGSTVLAARHHIVEHANTLAPVYILWSAFLLYFANRSGTRTMRVIVLALLLALGTLEFLTYSRSGWLGYTAFLGAYVVLVIMRSHRITRSAKQIALVCLIGILVVVAFQPLRQMSVRRITDITAASGRYFAFKLGIETVKTHPLTGTGWFNFYGHTKLLPDPPLKDVVQNRNLRDVHTHSMLIDLAETGGLPMMIVFVFIVAVHLKQPRKAPALTAGLIGISVNNVLDTASFWMTVYPHFWMLLALRRNALHELAAIPPETTGRIRGALPALVAILLAAGMSARLIEDHYLQKARFFQMTGRSAEALPVLRKARWFAPLDVVPLELMRDAYLSLRDTSGAEAILQRMISLKKEYAPYYEQIAKLKLTISEPEAASAIQTALKLDPHAALSGNPHILSAHLQFVRGSEDYRVTVYRAMVAKPSSMDSMAADLTNSIPEATFLNEALQFANPKSATELDRSVAIEQIYLALKKLNKNNLAKMFLENSWRDTGDVPGKFRDTFPYLLAGDYFSERELTKLKQLSVQVSTWGVPYVMGYHELAQGNVDAAKEHFSSITTAEDIDVGAWDRFWKKVGNEDAIRAFHRAVMRLPAHGFNPVHCNEIAASYLRERKFAAAASQYQNCTLYDFADPGPHWLEARMWWLAGDERKARLANERTQRLIATNPVVNSLYRSQILSSHPEHFTVVRAGLENDIGGMNWRTAIYAHPISVIVLPSDVKVAAMSGELGMKSPTWSGDTDGFSFSIADSTGKHFFTSSIDPAKNVSHRGWIPFQWNGQSQNVTLLSLPRATSNYDWALISVHSARP